MRARVAILFDGGFVTKKLTASLGRFPQATDIRENLERIMRHPRMEGCELLRAFYYDAPPLRDVVTNPVDGSRYDFGSNPVHGRNQSLQDTLSTSADFAIRRGEIVFRGWTVRAHALKTLIEERRTLAASDLGPEVEQKGVDLRIGLDVATLATKRVVETIVLVTGDSDLVPAMKFARREGLKVYLDTLGHGVRRAMREHADLVIG